MSLKNLHLAFISVCALLSVMLAYYAFATLAGPMRIVWSLSAILAAVLIVIYGIRFRRKMQDASFQ